MELNQIQQWVQNTFNSASDNFDHPALDFWNTIGFQSVDRLELQEGMRVLDVCCGTGASALPAAHQVGSQGRVTGVDLSENLLELARKKALAQGLTNTTFAVADMTQLSFEEKSFDAVIIVFGIFFVEDMESQISKLIKLIKPGGKLVVTTWGKNSLDPIAQLWDKNIDKIRPDLQHPSKPWNRVTTAKGLVEMIEGGGVKDPQAMEVRCNHPLATPQDWWYIARGSGFRGVIDAMTEDEQQLLNNNITAELGTLGAKTINTSYVIAWANF